MVVCVTGGTGFVGAHSAAEIVRRGHRVRLLARDRARVAHALDPLGVDPAAVDVVPGDVTDPVAVAEAVRGVDAVLHAAGVYSFDSRDREALARTNVRGTELVLDAALRAGAGPVVHVSSVGALFPSASGTIGPWSPVGRPREAYLASKATADEIARRYQDAGAPVLISYPPALLGPHDPRLGDQNARLRDLARGLMPIWPRGGLPLGDVRDTAALHADLVTGKSAGSNRFFGPGIFLSTKDYVGTVRAATGRALPTVFLPARAMFPIGHLADLAQRVWPWHIPAEYGALYVCAVAVPVAARAATAPSRPFGETVRDTLHWLRETGRLRPPTTPELGAATGKALP
jgi:nucleoside-diphosphate-sugar epimerase